MTFKHSATWAVRLNHITKQYLRPVLGYWLRFIRISVTPRILGVTTNYTFPRTLSPRKQASAITVASAHIPGLSSPTIARLAFSNDSFGCDARGPPGDCFRFPKGGEASLTRSGDVGQVKQGFQQPVGPLRTRAGADRASAVSTPGLHEPFAGVALIPQRDDLPPNRWEIVAICFLVIRSIVDEASSTIRSSPSTNAFPSAAKSNRNLPLRPVESKARIFPEFRLVGEVGASSRESRLRDSPRATFSRNHRRPTFKDFDEPGIHQSRQRRHPVVASPSLLEASRSYLTQRRKIQLPQQYVEDAVL